MIVGVRATKFPAPSYPFPLWQLLRQALKWHPIVYRSRHAKSLVHVTTISNLYLNTRFQIVHTRKNAIAFILFHSTRRLDHGSCRQILYFWGLTGTLVRHTLGHDRILCFLVHRYPDRNSVMYMKRREIFCIQKAMLFDTPEAVAHPLCAFTISCVFTPPPPPHILYHFLVSFDRRGSLWA